MCIILVFGDIPPPFALRTDFLFRDQDTMSCIDIRITNDQIREPLEETFTIQLDPYMGNEFVNLTVDEIPSEVTIIDDDRKK